MFPPKGFRKLVAALGVLLTIAIAVPSQKDLAIIVGGRFALEAARSPEAREVGGLVMDAVRATLRSAVREK